jgi:hypothetical protein
MYEAEIGALLRQPDSLKEMQNNKARFAVYNLPTISYTCTKYSIPGVSVKELRTSNPNTPLKFPGTVPEFEEMQLSFLVDQNCQNWLEIFNWIIGDSFPEYGEQRPEWVAAKPNATFRGTAYPMHSDATLFVLSTQNNPLFEVRYYDLFPVSLSSLEFDTGTTEAAPLVATCSFRYRSFQILNRRIVE